MPIKAMIEVDIKLIQGAPIEDEDRVRRWLLGGWIDGSGPDSFAFNACTRHDPEDCPEDCGVNASHYRATLVSVSRC